MESVDGSSAPPQPFLLPEISALITFRKAQLLQGCSSALDENMHLHGPAPSIHKTDQIFQDQDHGVPFETTSSESVSGTFTGSVSRPLQYSREELFALQAFHKDFPETSLQILQQLGPVMVELMALKVTASRGENQQNANYRRCYGNKTDNLGSATGISTPDMIWDGVMNQHDEAKYEEISSYSLNTGFENQLRGEFLNYSFLGSNDSEGSEDDMESFQQLAFLVHGEPNFDLGPPEDGFEYLRRVRWEAAQCPKIKVAKIAPKKLMAHQICYIPNIPAIPGCDLDLLPSTKWEREFLSDFSSLRLEFFNLSQETSCPLEPLPHSRNEKAWKVFCLGSAFSETDISSSSENNQIVNEVFEDNSSDYDNATENEGGDPHQVCSSPRDEVVMGHPPFLSVIKGLDEVSRAALFRYHVSWLDDTEGLPENRALWLFALAVAVDEPLNAETSAAFRTLLRTCATIRAKKKAQNDKELHMLNVLITISGQYFGQADDRSW